MQRKSATALAKTCPRHAPKRQQTKEQTFFLHNSQLGVTVSQLSGEVSATSHLSIKPRKSPLLPRCTTRMICQLLSHKLSYPEVARRRRHSFSVHPPPKAIRLTPVHPNDIKGHRFGTSISPGCGISLWKPLFQSSAAVWWFCAHIPLQPSCFFLFLCLLEAKQLLKQQKRWYKNECKLPHLDNRLRFWCLELTQLPGAQCC